MTSTHDRQPTDAELIAVLAGQADEATMARIASAIERDPTLELRLAALDDGVPAVSEALDVLVSQAPVDDLARALAATLTDHATRSTAASGPAAIPGISWGTLAVVGALTFAAGVWVGSEGREQLRTRIEPPAPVLSAPPAIVDPAPPAADVSAPPAVVETAPPAVVETVPPAVVETVPPAVVETVPPAVALGPPEPTRPSDGREISQPQEPPVTVAEPKPEPAPIPLPPSAPAPSLAVAEAPTRPAATPWVAAVASYVRLMTEETLTQTALPATRQRTQLTKLSQTFGVDLKRLVGSVPGLALQRIEVLQFNGRPLLQLGFVEADGTPVAFCILLRPSSAATGLRDLGDPVFRKESIDDLNAVHWDRQPRGFLVIGRTSRERLNDAAQRMARAL